MRLVATAVLLGLLACGRYSPPIRAGEPSPPPLAEETCPADAPCPEPRP